jgi:hypothetical protein
MDAILGAWQFSPILTLASGFPFDVTCIYCYNVSTRPNVAGPIQQLNSPHLWFDTTSFVKVPTSSSGTPVAPGNSSRNPFTGPGTKTMDLNVSKNFSVTERVRIWFSGDFFNIFNTPQFNQPDGNLNNGTFGTITALKLDGERQIQIGLRVSF